MLRGVTALAFKLIDQSLDAREPCVQGSSLLPSAPRIHVCA